VRGVRLVRHDAQAVRTGRYAQHKLPGFWENLWASADHKMHMTKESFEIMPIGIIHSPFAEPQGTPIQPSEAGDVLGTVSVDPEYAEGLSDLAGFERIWLIYWFHHSQEYKLKVIPFRDKEQRGLFSTRAPKRPNAIGISCVRLICIKGNVLTVSGIDVVDGTPLLDIKPYVPAFDSFPESKAGWLDASLSKRNVADDRFKNEE